MSTTTMPLSHLNGAGVVPAELVRETEFLQNILQIREQVFASKHPHIRLPPKVIEQVAPRLPHSTSNRKSSANGTPNGSASLPFSTRSGGSHQHPTPPLAPTQRPYSATSSGIDPVLLTKSDQLIKAELQLKRQQIERQLKDQFDKKGRVNDTEEREALINVEDCLHKAHLRVPPICGLRPTTNNNDAAESFDENSYYSSKADSWSSDEVDPSQNAHAYATSPLTSQAKQTARPLVLQSRPVEPTVIDLDEEAYEPADDIEIYEPDSLLQDDAEDEDYSPPPADIGPSEPWRGRGRARGAGNGDTNGSSRRQSPAGPVASLQNPRKRRRDDKRDEKRRPHQINKRTTVPSPETYIKQEPQSPPRFAADTDAQPSKRRALQVLPSDMDVVALHEDARAHPLYYRDQEPSARPHREIEEHSSPTVIHMPQRRMQRDEQDLRRVASLQYARRPYSPGSGAEMFQVPESRQVRAASHAFIDRPEPPMYREASVRPLAGPRYGRERSRSPVLQYLPRQPSPVLMAPPPRRIVVDQYGNKYYAAPVEARESMAPPGRRIEVDPYFERAATREPTMRAPGRAEMYEEEVGPRMLPPPRRYAEAHEMELLDSPAHRQREVSRRPMEVEYRAMPQYSEMGPPRAYSMRPESHRRDVGEGYVRHESVQPGPARVPQPRFREVSIAHEEGFDERRYVGAPQGRRYGHEGAVEVGQERYHGGEGRRVYARY